ncbi:MAG TPA: hypothetical protein VEJ38_06205 [Candidatus Acidoferrales bacterium]|nr:hypothetical protein [Candidatus Acidoferrales bacterium]
MNRRILFVAIFLAASVFTASCSRGHYYIVATSGTPQSTPINTPFGAPLVATVTNSAGKGVKGVKVTFTAPPQSGPSATFSGGGTTATATTDSNGVATSPTVSANGNAGGPYTVVATVNLTKEPALFVLNNTGGTAAGISCVSGSSQSAQVDTAFANPLEVQVVDSGGFATSDPGVVVTMTPPATGPSATFAGGVNTATTNATGLATSVQVSANAIAGGPYQVTATATISETVKACNFSLTNSSIPVTTENFVYYAIGEELNNGGPNFYALAGVVTIEITGPAPGTVLGGEQDYNDAFGITATDLITGGILTVDPTTGLGTLTLDTSDDALGGVTTPEGDIVLAVQFVNPKHALVAQFDGSDTSSGSMDLQTSTSKPSGNFGFTLSGVDSGYCPVVSGGVFSISGSGLTGTFDFQDICFGEGTAVTGTAFPEGVTVNAPDELGRGTITNATGIADTIAYYDVGPEVARIIDIDDDDSAVGSAYGQGAGAFSNSSLGTFVFEDIGNSWFAFSDATGMMTTSPGAGTAHGVADVNEDGSVVQAAPVPATDGSYTIAANGYGSLTIANGDWEDLAQFGIYMTDPNLNLNDPNNTASGLGGALITDLSLIGTGVIVPQTDTATASFAGNYAFGAQAIDSESENETDFVGQGAVASNALTGTGDISDPFGLFGGVNPVMSGATFAGTAIPDGSNPGRYEMDPLAITPPELGESDLLVAVYQASGGQLFWIDDDDGDWFMGPLEQQAAPVTPLQAAAIAKPKPTQKK